MIKAQKHFGKGEESQLGSSCTFWEIATGVCPPEEAAEKLFEQATGGIVSSINEPILSDIYNVFSTNQTPTGQSSLPGGSGLPPGTYPAPGTYGPFQTKPAVDMSKYYIYGGVGIGAVMLAILLWPKGKRQFGRFRPDRVSYEEATHYYTPPAYPHQPPRTV